MAGKFDGYVARTREEKEAILDNGIISLDASVLLNLFEYKPSVAEDWLDKLKGREAQLFVPYTAALETLNGIERVRKEHREAYTEIEKAVAHAVKLAKKAATKRPTFHPVVDQSALQKFTDGADVLKEDLAKTQKEARRAKDDLLTRVHALIDDNVGEACPNLKTEIEEAHGRNAELQPPGYMDATKGTPRARAGDYLVWRETLNEAIRLSKPFVFVTADEKEDWWDLEGKRARSDLTLECFLETNQHCYFMLPDAFIKQLGASEETVEATHVEQARRSAPFKDFYFNAGADAALARSPDYSAAHAALRAGLPDLSAAHEALRVGLPDLSAAHAALAGLPDLSAAHEAIKATQARFSVTEAALEAAHASFPAIDALKAAHDTLSGTGAAIKAAQATLGTSADFKLLADATRARTQSGGESRTDFEESAGPHDDDSE